MKINLLLLCVSSNKQTILHSKVKEKEFSEVKKTLEVSK
jgi:hypothetical protein